MVYSFLIGCDNGLLANGIWGREKNCIRDHNRMKLLNRKRPHSCFSELHADFERPLRSVACKHRLDAAIESLDYSHQKRRRASLMPSHSAETRPQMADGEGIIRLVLHPEADRSHTENQKHELRKSGLHELLIHSKSSEITLALDKYVRILGTQQASVDAFMPSPGHCTLECLCSPGTPQQHAYLTDKSRNGVCIDGIRMVQGVKYQLVHGQTVTLLNSSPGSILTSYVAQDLRAHTASRPMAVAVGPLSASSSMQLPRRSNQERLAASSRDHGSGLLTHPTPSSSHRWRTSEDVLEAQRLELSLRALQISAHDTRPATSVVKSRLM